MTADDVYMRPDDPEANFQNMKAFAARMMRERDTARRIAEDWRRSWAIASGCPWDPQFPWSE